MLKALEQFMIVKSIRKEDNSMRKVFMSTMLLGEIKKTTYISEDFVLSEQHYDFPLSYLIDNEVRTGDEVEIITAVEHGEGGVQTSVQNYEAYVQEVKSILAERGVQVHFTEVITGKKLEDKTFTKFFKKLTALLKEDDEVYADFTFGMKAYSLSMFIALAYAVKSAQNIDLRCLLYAEKYTGTDAAEQKNTSELCDITSLFYLDAIAGNARAGQKEELDEVMQLIIKD